jgi:radical SAM superfamily enzyme YgiQ (UPF0313 family)
VNGSFATIGPQAAFNPDELPLPDRTVTETDRAHYFIDWMSPVACVRSTVGCPYRCTFCSLWKLMDGRYYMRDINAVVGELATIREDFVMLIDDEAFINQPRMIKLAESLDAAGIHKRYFTYCRIDTLLRNRDAIAAWRRIGLERLLIGIDAISEKDLLAYNKRLELEQIEAGLRTARELGVDVFAQFVVNTDYTKRDFERLARFVEHHKIRYPSFTVLTPIPGTELLTSFDSVTENQPNGRPNWDFFDMQNAVTKTALPAEEFRREYRALYKTFKSSYSEHYRHHYQATQTGPARVPSPV